MTSQVQESQPSTSTVLSMDNWTKEGRQLYVCQLHLWDCVEALLLAMRRFRQSLHINEQDTSVIQCCKRETIRWLSLKNLMFLCTKTHAKNVLQNSSFQGYLEHSTQYILPLGQSTDVGSSWKLIKRWSLLTGLFREKCARAQSLIFYF